MLLLGYTSFFLSGVMQILEAIFTSLSLNFEKLT